MIRLHREHVRAPATWRQRVSQALPNAATYYREARGFEQFDVNSPCRRSGFTLFAPQVLRKRRGKPHFPAVWRAAKEALAIMSHGKCAYCEGEINAARSGQVDHFQPKSLFPSLAYDWDNYFLACGGCNGAKGDKWPDDGAYLRPDREDPSTKLCFTVDGMVKAVGAATDADQTIQDFDLKREWLVRRRKKQIELMLGRLRDAVDAYHAKKDFGRRLARSEVQRLKDPANAYSAALTQCFLREWKSACPGVRL